MAVFGAPVAHEDDAERAVRSALRVIGAIAELNEEHPGLELSVRIGITTGEAVVALGARPGEGEGMFHRALALLGSARCLVGLGRGPEAIAPARHAKDTFHAVGARWLSAEAAALAPDASSATL